MVSAFGIQMTVPELAHSLNTVELLLLLSGDDDYETLRCFVDGTNFMEEMRNLSVAPWPVHE